MGRFRLFKGIIPSWVIDKLTNQPWVDYCLECRVEIISEEQHCLAEMRNHHVVRILPARGQHKYTRKTPHYVP